MSYSEFWRSELGEISGSPQDAFTKTFEIIPNNTKALAKIADFSEIDLQGVRMLNVTWELTEGEYKGATVNQRLKVIDRDPRDKDPTKTRHRGLNMLKLLFQQFNFPIPLQMPNAHQLAAFKGRTAGIKICETKPNAEGKTYNYVAEVHPAKGFASESGIKLQSSRTVNDAYTYSGFDFNKEENDIPF